MIRRDIEEDLRKDAQTAPVIAIIGPRQSGKTTIARSLFGEHAYVTLEEFETREFAFKDPRGFLQMYDAGKGLIIDEIQHVPQLLSYIQTIVDFNYRPGFFILTGSQNFLVNQAITQTLAGRISIQTLLPFSANELKQASLLPLQPEELMFKGGYPPLYSRAYDPTNWYNDYVTTYLERDVHTISAVGDLNVFRRFIKLCAGRIGQVINLSSLAIDCGISQATVKHWLSILEASYIIFSVKPYERSFNKRVIKTPKLYFYDTGLACNLLDIESSKQLDLHHSRGALFESFVMSELYKSFCNHDRKPALYFWRDQTGHEVDCIIESAGTPYPIEIKAGRTITSDYFTQLDYWQKLADDASSRSFVIYAGDARQERTNGTAVSWREINVLYESLIKKA